MAIQGHNNPFNAHIHATILCHETFYIETPEHFIAKNDAETTGEFEGFCENMRLVAEICEDNQALAEAIANLLNRAYAMGQNA